MAVLGYIAKLNRSLKWFFHKNVPYFYTLSMENVSMSHLTSFSRYQKNVLLSFYLDSWWRLDLRFFLDQPPKQWLTERKRGLKKQKFECLENVKNFLDEIKTFFIVFERVSFGEK